MRSVFMMPVFNQHRELPALLEEIDAAPLACDELLLVNNGSSDGSEDLVRAAGYPYLDLPKNLGVGHGYMCAVDWAMDNGFDVIGTMAANGKMLPSEMHRLLDPIESGETDCVTGSRFMPGGQSPNLRRFRRLSIPMVNGFVRLLYGAKLTDATCGYRALKLDVFRDVRPDWHRESLYTYGFEYYIYAKVIGDRRWRWAEVPITMRYPPMGERYSKIRPFRDWYGMLKPWVVARFERT